MGGGTLVTGAKPGGGPEGTEPHAVGGGVLTTDPDQLSPPNEGGGL